MVVGELIEISSSDSDLEIEDVRDNIGSANGRSLPSWAFTRDASPGSRGNSVESLKVPSPRRAYASNGSSLLIDSLTKAKNPIHPHSSGIMGASNQHVAENVSLHQPQSVNSQVGNTFSTDYEKISSRLALKRIPSRSLQTSATDIKSKNSVDYNSRSQIQNSYGGSYHPVGLNPMSSRSYMRDHSGWGIDNHENGGSSRILPPSLTHAKSTPVAQFGSSSDPAHRSGMGEERVAESDETPIYRAALQDLNQPKVEANLPDGLLSVPLLRHQKIALAWMLQKEKQSWHCCGGILADDQGLGKTVSMIALIQMQKSLESKTKSEEVLNCRPEALNLDDDDDNDGNVGLDKGKKNENSDDIKLVSEASSSIQTFSKGRTAAGTLVVCPASVLRQWDRELDEKVANEAKLSVLIYHGGSRTKDPVTLAKYDVVLTTYSIVANEVPKQPLVDEDDPDEKGGEKYGLSSEFSMSKKRKNTSVSTKKGKKGRKDIDSSFDCGPLARVAWLRVILDEAQTIKNHRTQVARACCSLKAKRRWCLSGTPIQNAIDDLYSYFRFLKYDPYAVYKSFYNTIKVPISRNSIQGYKKLQAVLRAIMLRRTKGTLIDGEPIIKLPPKTIELTRVDFTSEERAFYTQLEADSRSQFKAYAAAGTVNQNYANILLMLLRLRQACDHPSLVQGYNSDFVGKDSVEMARTLPKEMLIRLLSILEDSKAICCICADPPENPVITMCDHIFCYQCVSDNLTVDDSICPVTGCKEQIGSDLVFSKATLRRCISSDFDGGSLYSGFSEKAIVMQNEYSSSKVRAILEILQLHCNSSISNSERQGFKECEENLSSQKEKMDSCSSGFTVVKHTTFSNPPAEGRIKYIIFSQWTSMLDLVEQSLNQSYIQYRRLDGTMTLSARDKGVREFNTDPEITVMLMSLKAGNLGLNMVAACHVILLDLWWNPTTEDQAVDRAHRIGQTRPVTVTRLTIKDTVEDRILALQEEKRKMVASAFGEDHGGGAATRLTVEDLKYLFMV